MTVNTFISRLKVTDLQLQRLHYIVLKFKSKYFIVQIINKTGN